MKNKVGIVSCYFKYNYGSMLQAYATKKILDNNNIPNETIDITANVDFAKGKKKYYLSQVTNYKFIKSKFGMVKLKFHKKLKKDLGKNCAIRDEKFKEFCNMFNLTPKTKTYLELTEMAKENYSDVIVGSDQLWLPVNVVADYYTLNWVPDDINKISYATSFGISQVPTKYRTMYNSFLNRINYLSVREETGVKMVEDLSNNKAKLVCDPTLLLTKEEWNEIVAKERIIKDKYILCYFLGNNIDFRKFAEKIKEKTGYIIVSLNHTDEYMKYSDIFADIAPYDVGPSEFINLIQNAEYVCTDSFHATVFSLINNKKFFTFRRFSSKNKMSTNSRVESLLDIVDLKERLLDGKESVEEKLKLEINYDKVNQKIDAFRNESKKWLLDAISFNKVNFTDN